MIVVNTETVSGREIRETLGICKGNTVRARNFESDILAGLKNFIGGEVEEYTKLLDSARDQANARMVKMAKEMGADAIVNVRYTTSNIMQGCSEILAYGTA
ncbi:YbjQ family protein, partial [Bacteroidales bacterium OttesenSCG-928-I21]|nr:YbjQ family protein [Bacteroidales bacterium OttesenSCG-928-I21]